MNTSQPNTKSDSTYRNRTTLLSVLALAALLAGAPGALADCDCVCEQIDSYRVLTAPTDWPCVDVAGGATLVIEGCTLTLTGNCTSTIEGSILLSTSSSTLAFTNNHTVSGDGDIDGQHNSARINITSAVTVTIGANLTVHGSMEIQAGSGTLDNDGLVEGDDDGGTLTCYSGTFAGSGVYKVAWPGATLNFASGIDDTGLAADFRVGNATATLDIDEDICSTGDLSFTGGTINVAAGKSFKAGGTCPSQQPQAPAESDP